MKPTAGAFGGTVLVRLTSPGVYLPHRLAAVGAFTLFDQSFLVCYGAGGHYNPFAQSQPSTKAAISRAWAGVMSDAENSRMSPVESMARHESNCSM